MTSIPFKTIRPEHVVPSVREALARAEEDLQDILTITGKRTYENTIQRLDDMEEALEKVFGVVSHLESVASSSEFREAYNTVLPEYSRFSAKLGLNQNLWQAIRDFAESEEGRNLTGLRKRRLEKLVQSFRRSGADLPDKKRARVEEIRIQLSDLHNRFSQNTLDATNAFEMLLTDPKDVAGLPERVLDQACQDAEQQGSKGWRFTLHMPSYMPFMQYAEQRHLRQRMHEAYMSRATTGDNDNRPLIEQILALRHEMAQILGYKDFSDYRLETHMAKTGAKARAFVEDLAQQTRAIWKVEVEDLQRFASDLGLDPIQPWDVAFIAEKLRKERFSFDEEDVRPYFPLEQVLQGVFGVAERLFGIRVIEKENEQVWHPDVRYFEIHDEQGVHMGSFYTDWFPRANKRGGAWMNHFITGGPRADGFEPHLGLMCGNFTPPAEGKPALLTHREVETVAHEFGHLLHHCLSTVEIPALAGTNVPWDFVELPSQLMENWMWEKEVLDLFARHYETGETLPADLFEKMKQAKNFLGASFQMRQLAFGTIDLMLHQDYAPNPSGGAIAFAQKVMEGFSIRPEFARNAFIATFTHVFTGGYASAYYSYKWSEVLDADVFSQFKVNGIFDRATGEAYLKTILSQGSSKDADELFRDFMGRDPNPRALYRRNLEPIASLLKNN